MIIPNRLYNGQIEIFFNEGNHTYFKDEEKISPVTKILEVMAKPALIPWAAKQSVLFMQDEIKAGRAYDEIELKSIFEVAAKAHISNRNAAGTIGTFVHQWIHEYITKQSPATPINKDIQTAVDKFLAWEKKHQVKFILSEEMVYSQKHNFAGTLDFIAEIDGELVLGDVKTSSGIWREYWLQVAAYQLARNEEFPEEKYSYRGIIRVDKKSGEFEWKTSLDADGEDQFESHASAFLYANELYKALERIK